MNFKNFFLVLTLFISVSVPALNGTIYRAAAYKKSINNQDYFIYTFSDCHIFDKRNLEIGDSWTPGALLDFSDTNIPKNLDALQAKQLLSQIKKHPKDQSLLIVENILENNEYHKKVTELLQLNASTKQIRHYFLNKICHIVGLNNIKKYNIEYRKNLVLLKTSQLVNSTKESKFFENCKTEWNALFNRLLEIDDLCLRQYFLEILSEVILKGESIIQSDTLVDYSAFSVKLIDLNILYTIYKNQQVQNIYICAGGIHIQNVEEKLFEMGYTKVLSSSETITSQLMGKNITISKLKSLILESKPINLITNFFNKLNNNITIKSKL